MENALLSFDDVNRLCMAILDIRFCIDYQCIFDLVKLGPGSGIINVSVRATKLFCAIVSSQLFSSCTYQKTINISITGTYYYMQFANVTTYYNGLYQANGHFELVTRKEAFWERI